jgi:hypothetical protein
MADSKSSNQLRQTSLREKKIADFGRRISQLTLPHSMPLFLAQAMMPFVRHLTIAADEHPTIRWAYAAKPISTCGIAFFNLTLFTISYLSLPLMVHKGISWITLKYLRFSRNQLHGAISMSR